MSLFTGVRVPKTGQLAYSRASGERETKMQLAYSRASGEREKDRDNKRTTKMEAIALL